MLLYARKRQVADFCTMLRFWEARVVLVLAFSLSHSFFLHSSFSLYLSFKDYSSVSLPCLPKLEVYLFSILGKPASYWGGHLSFIEF